MKMRNWRLVLGAAMGLLMLATVAGAQDKGTAGSGSDQAQTILQRMADLLKQTKQYAVTLESEYDVVQKSGEKIEFGEIRKALRLDDMKRRLAEAEAFIERNRETYRKEIEKSAR